MLFNRPEVQKYMDYVRTKGRSGDRTVEILKDNEAFLASFNTQIGFELLKDLCGKHEELLNKISRLDADVNDRVEYKVVKDLIIKWSDRINAYIKAVDTINKEANSRA
jgi:hypothetical protein